MAESRPSYLDAGETIITRLANLVDDDAAPEGKADHCENERGGEMRGSPSSFGVSTMGLESLTKRKVLFRRRF